MKKSAIAVFVLIISFSIISSSVSAHYGMVIPSDSMVMQGEKKNVTLMISFSHPFERIGMEMAKPKLFGVTVGGKMTDLVNDLKAVKIMNHQGWRMDYQIKRPGVYNFVMEPTPYWEPAEDCFIIHYTKTVVAAFGDDEGWDAECGLKTEIIPLTKPFGLYVGNVFQGIVKLNGQAVPYAEVEIEYYNADGRSQAPTDYMITQSAKADGNGIFTYAAPKSGWWGFAALNTADFKLKHNGQDKNVELGAVIWVAFHDWQLK